MTDLIFGGVTLAALVFLGLWLRGLLQGRSLRERADACRVEAQNLAHDKSQILHAISRAVELINVGRAKEARTILLDLKPEFKNVCRACARAQEVGCRFCPVCGKPVPPKPKPAKAATATAPTPQPEAHPRS